MRQPHGPRTIAVGHCGYERLAVGTVAVARAVAGAQRSAIFTLEADTLEPARGRMMSMRMLPTRWLAITFYCVHLGPPV